MVTCPIPHPPVRCWHVGPVGYSSCGAMEGSVRFSAIGRWGLGELGRRRLSWVDLMWGLVYYGWRRWARLESGGRRRGWLEPGSRRRGWLEPGGWMWGWRGMCGIW